MIVSFEHLKAYVGLCEEGSLEEEEESRAKAGW